MRICFDIDETICRGYPYEEAQPIVEVCEYIRQLKAAGHTIVLFTARGMRSSNGNTAKAIASLGGLTIKQLEEWNVPYDELMFGKPSYDVFVDDKSISSIHQLKKYLGD